jgi:hypothetical protein
MASRDEQRNIVLSSLGLYFRHCVCLCHEQRKICSVLLFCSSYLCRFPFLLTHCEVFLFAYRTDSWTMHFRHWKTPWKGDRPITRFLPPPSHVRTHVNKKTGPTSEQPKTILTCWLIFQAITNKCAHSVSDRFWDRVLRFCAADPLRMRLFNPLKTKKLKVLFSPSGNSNMEMAGVELWQSKPKNSKETVPLPLCFKGEN